MRRRKHLQIATMPLSPRRPVFALLLALPAAAALVAWREPLYRLYREVVSRESVK